MLILIKALNGSKRNYEFEPVTTVLKVKEQLEVRGTSSSWWLWWLSTLLADAVFLSVTIFENYFLPSVYGRHCSATNSSNFWRKATSGRLPT